MTGLGDRRPSQLMEEMLHLHQGKAVCYLSKEIFLQQLPAAVRTHLSAEDFSDPRRVALRADRLWCDSLHAATPSSAVVCPVSVSSDAPDALLAPISRRGTAPASDSSPSMRPTTTTPLNREHQRTLCYYHKRFGARAHRCRSPCPWSGNGSAGHQN